MFFPMYVVKVSDFLRMEGALLSHAELVKQNLLQKWEQGMYTVFISHQWLGRQHPDPSGAQTSVLRKLIARLEQEDLMIEGDTVSASYGQRLTLSEDTRKNILEGYLFLDWFAIPQVTARLHGVNEATTKSDAALAVKSIPAYVECADIFIALVPYVLNEEKKWCNHSTWIARGGNGLFLKHSSSLFLTRNNLGLLESIWISRNSLPPKDLNPIPPQPPKSLKRPLSPQTPKARTPWSGTSLLYTWMIVYSY